MESGQQDLASLRTRLGQHLATWRMSRKLTQAQLGRAAQVDRSTVAHIEAGRAGSDERFWRVADARCGANGELLDEFKRFEAAKLAFEVRKHEAELAEARGKVARLREIPAGTGETIEHVRRLYRTDVGPHTLEQLHLAAEELCCDYAWRDAGEVKADAGHWLHYIARLLDGPCTLKEHRDLMVLSGWLMLLMGCIEYDLGRGRRAESWRVAAKQVGEDTGHSHLIAWSFEMSAWFALTQGELKEAARFAEAGVQAAPRTPVAVQLAAQSAKAAARMGEMEAVHRALDESYRFLAGRERPARPENHFVIDPQKWDLYAMDCYRIAGEDRRATEHAQEVLRISHRPDGSERSPMRAAEARLTLAMVSAREGDLEIAADWTRKALGASRKSADSFLMVAGELEREISRLFPKDPAAEAVIDSVRQARSELKPG